jgi:hypothetical protein
VRDALPADTPMVTPAQRKAEQAKRVRDLAVRLRTSSNQAAPVIKPALHQLMGIVGAKPVLAIYAGSSLTTKG